MAPKHALKEVFRKPQKGDLLQEFMVNAKRQGPWKLQSVAMVILSQDGSRVLLTQVRKVISREPVDYLRVPLQGRMEGLNPDPLTESSRILREKASVRIDRDDIHYLGYGFSTNYAVGHTCNKLIHWAACVYPHDAPPSPTEYAARFEWIHVDALPAYAQQMMDERKGWLFNQAVKTAVKEGPFGPSLLRRIV